MPKLRMYVRSYVLRSQSPTSKSSTQRLLSVSRSAVCASRRCALVMQKPGSLQTARTAQAKYLHSNSFAEEAHLTCLTYPIFFVVPVLRHGLTACNSLPIRMQTEAASPTLILIPTTLMADFSFLDLVRRSAGPGSQYCLYRTASVAYLGSDRAILSSVVIQRVKSWSFPDCLATANSTHAR
ncbi:hypothetical protein CONLIGDRAFT_341282 [Coniochaeta ligniaria NRRL 30616]|uniref:Uncharacterized protein n=1 Tax=Coniochaeta ligniaria NRRL 30616 TaxID=1408157 RepID=A0A1J7IQT4_9PEZI|nr:hypothetical protein CONLIGDRAFT_341282 [Coniochaeta ligniaria NRRL 30616]